MNFEAKLKKKKYDQLWQEYCGFLDLSLQEYMQIQRRLMEEQIKLWSDSKLGRSILDDQNPKTVEEFRKVVPLTSYVDYADILLRRRNDMLPDTPVVWIETTWEGGKRPIKAAPYTRGMLDAFKNNLMSIYIFATSTERGKFSARSGDKTLYGLAPLPYVTGLLPLLIDEEVKMRFFPPASEAVNMSFGERNKKGFEIGLHKGLDLFFGLSSVIAYMTESFSQKGSSGGKLKQLFKFSPRMMIRYLRASYRCKCNGTQMMPKDIFRLKGLLCAGTDTASYKQYLEQTWGLKPLEITAGTELSCIGTETWAHDGMVLFPDACFYEFIPELEMQKNIEDPSYEPKTFLMDEIVPNQNYELVISNFKGGAFVRYRVGDVYRCIGVGENQSGDTKLPRFELVDRIPTVIDIAGFTRITEDAIEDVIKLSGLSIGRWMACKEYSDRNRPYLALYVEMDPDKLSSIAISKNVLIEHLSVYFRYFDSDYKDLKRLLGMDPLQVTFLRTGTVDYYERKYDVKLRRINPSTYQITEILKLQQTDFAATRREGVR